MSNISITSICNRSCDYCFARSTFKEHEAGSDHMPAETFELALDFLERSGIDQVRMLGGEPTLHPFFPALVDRIETRGLQLMIFSNGLMPERSLQRIEAMPPERLGVLLNATDFEKLDPNNEKQLREVLGRLGRRVMLGLNIYSPGIPLKGLIDIIKRFDLCRTIRLGLAHPCLASHNIHLPLRHYSLVGQKLHALSKTAAEEGISFEFDCGFVPCMFPKGDFQAFGPAGADIGLRCNPILDILPNGKVVSCYPLASLEQLSLTLEHSAEQMQHVFEEKFAPFRRLGIFSQCADCRQRRDGSCRGGCLAAAMKRLRGDDFLFSIEKPLTPSAIDSSHLSTRSGESSGGTKADWISAGPQWVIPYIDEAPYFWKEIDRSFGKLIKEVYFPLPLNIVGSGRPAQPDAHLDSFLDNAPVAKSVLINPAVLTRPVEELAPIIIGALQKLAERYGIRAATVTNLNLAALIRKALPAISITGSVLMDIARPIQSLMVAGICDSLVPASRIMRDLPALRALRKAFSGRIRLIVNEACLPHCPLRVQHFYEMSTALQTHPRSLCAELLKRHPWMRLTGAWVLPQHVHLFDGLYDDLKLAGRVTLHDPEKYIGVLEAYVNRTPLTPNQIGGGPASVLEPLEVDQSFYAETLHCGHQCHTCTRCPDYYRQHCAT